MIGAVPGLVLGYLAGAIPFGVLSARLFGLGDLRAVGSGNIGATNVLRTGNRWAAAATLLGDMLKGLAAVLAAGYLWGADAAALAALGAVIGHCFPVWLRFKGGKGVATYLGALAGLSLWGLLIAACIWLGMAAWRRVSSLASLTATALAPIPVLIFVGPAAALAVLAMSALVWFRHKDNIVRLRAGTEPKIGARKQGSDQ